MKRIFCVLPIPYGPNWGFWTRDAGLMVLALREMGYDAWLVALGDASADTTDRPVLAVGLKEMSSPEWWQAQRPDGVVLSTASAARYDGIRKAALSATPRVVERLDTDGTRSARLSPRMYFIRDFGSHIDSGSRLNHFFAPMLAVARTSLLYTFTNLVDEPAARSMKQLPAAMAESPISAERVRRIFEGFTGSTHRVVMIPHPVNARDLHYSGVAKENRIISVGRWNSFQKDYPMLRRVLKVFLERHPDWQATVVGGGVPLKYQREQTEEWAKRVTHHANLNHEDLALEYNRSKIYLMASRYESFCIAGAEALCCGCSVVGSADVPTSYYFAELQSGRVAEPRSRRTFSIALEAEADSWAKGQRNPKLISSAWLARTGAREVSEATMALLGDIVPWDSPAKSS